MLSTQIISESIMVLIQRSSRARPVVGIPRIDLPGGA